MVDGFLPASKVMELFDGDVIAPGAGRNLYVGGGGYPEQLEGAEGRTVYYPGGSMELGALNKAVAAAGPSGLTQVGGRRSRRRRTRRCRRMSSTRQKNKRNRSRRQHK